MRREIKDTKVSIVTEPFPNGIDPVEWLQQQAENAHSALLLAHADDGVIWGKVANGALITMPEEVPLRTATLQQARLFSAEGEYYVWRDGDGKFHARIIKEGEGTQTEYLDEVQVLWGDHAEPVANGFMKMSDGAQGLVHYVPIKLQKREYTERPLRLIVRHYLSKDEHGFVRVAFSRLVKLEAKES